MSLFSIFAVALIPLVGSLVIGVIYHIKHMTHIWNVRNHLMWRWFGRPLVLLRAVDNPEIVRVGWVWRDPKYNNILRATYRYAVTSKDYDTLNLDGHCGSYQWEPYQGWVPELDRKPLPSIQSELFKIWNEGPR